MSTRPSTEVLVVGGGPAGLATAIAASLEGLDSLVVDRARPPIDKPCGEGLMPEAVASLEALGVDLDPQRCFPFRGVRYVDGQDRAEASFPGRDGLGVRRPVLHRAMVRRAEALGVRFAWGTRVVGLDRGGVETTARRLSARWIVAADGARSQLRRWAGLDGRPARWRRFGVRRHFEIEPWSDRVEVHWADGGEAYVTPVGRREVGVAMLWSGRKASFDRLLRLFPSVAERLAAVPVTSHDRGAGPLRQRSLGVARGRLALVGDAAGYIDAIAGDGLATAFGQAIALASALREGTLRPYAGACRRIGSTSRLFTRLLLVIERRPSLRRRMIRAFSRDPELFRRLIALHTGGGSRPREGWRAAPRLLFRLAGL